MMILSAASHADFFENQWAAMLGTSPRSGLYPFRNPLFEKFADELIPGSKACDLACGDGRLTLEMLRRGVPVLAVDASPNAVARVQERAGSAGCSELLTVRQDDITQFVPPPGLQTVVCAGVFPCLNADQVSTIARAARAALEVPGYFYGALETGMKMELEPGNAFRFENQHDHRPEEVLAIFKKSGFIVMETELVPVGFEVALPLRTAEQLPTPAKTYRLSFTLFEFICAKRRFEG